MGHLLAITRYPGIFSEKVRLTSEKHIDKNCNTNITGSTRYDGELVEMVYPIKISIVEDDPVHAKLVEIRLRKLGYNVISVFSSGQDAIENLPKAYPNLLIMDIRIEGDLDGIDTAREIASRYHIPAVFLSSSSDDTTIERVKTVPGAEYVTKPFKDDDLRIAIRLALAKYQFLHQLENREMMLSTLLAQVPAAIIATDSNGVITYLNETAISLLQWKNPVIGGTHFREIVMIFDKFEMRALENPHEKIRVSNDTHWIPMNAVLLADNQGRIPIVGSMSPLKNPDGSVGGMLAVLFPTIKQNYLGYGPK